LKSSRQQRTTTAPDLECEGVAARVEVADGGLIGKAVELVPSILVGVGVVLALMEVSAALREPCRGDNRTNADMLKLPGFFE